MESALKYKEALEEGLHLFGLLRHAADSKNSADLADAGILLIEKTLRPKPEYIDVEEEVGWVNVYQHESGEIACGTVYIDKVQADRIASGRIDFLSCQPIKVTVQREKKAPVERSVTVEAYTDGMGDVYSMDDDCPFIGKAESYNRRGSLTFTWTEEPTT